MTFTQLLALFSGTGQQPRVCADSRQVQPGDIFVAIVGTHADSHGFIPQAVERGASVVVCQKEVECGNAQRVIVADSSEALGILAQAACGNPAAQLTNLAVTGTKGKTTVAFLTRSVIQTAGKNCGLIGTIIYDTGNGRPIPAPLTTPDALQIAQLGREMLENGAQYMAVEASSHALSQNRLAGVDFTAAAFTNLTGDHLDYHKTQEEYLAAKMRLFTGLPIHATAILNRQSPASKEIAAKIRCRILWYAVNEPADISGWVDSIDMHGMVFSIEFNRLRCQVKSPMPGLHNVSNHLAAAGLCLAAGFDLPTVARGLTALKSVPGRLEPVRAGQSFAVLVDYAHTDDALKNVLATLRPLCKGKLIALFGCGGDRDKTKRPRMARVCWEMADRIFVTSDNPRTEDPIKIIEDILPGFENPNDPRITVQPDRRAAIEAAIQSAGPEDIVLLAGKGHEDYQILGTTKIHFDDREIARQTLEKLPSPR
ncbi:MAG: UDP-N-acetylmuramoyl-L-alanyl-D-glutamate--2,6-diaminopimelate ligase [Phycisphaerae bacterium]|nr:UDP-N-acetylmuramoyl-L-alanyl-D-glutamate--2,6-diaminopimelate ligase [Phycisphaerae bacterium]